MNGKKSNGIGTIRKRREGLWEARYTAGTDLLTGKQIQKSVYGKTKPEAKEKLAAAIANLPQQEEILPSSSFSFGSWLDKWIKDYCCTRKPNTIEQYEYQIRVNIKPALGKIALSELDGEQIQHLYNTLMKPHKLLSGNGRVLKSKGLSAKSIKNVHGVIHESLTKAVQLHYIRENPSDSCELPKTLKPQIYPIPGTVISAFIAEIRKDELSALMFVTLFTGMRQGEIMGLRWVCVDFYREYLTISHQLQKERKPGGEYKFAPLKNDKQRVFMVADDVLNALRRVRAKQSEWKLAAGENWINDENYVFTTELGRHLSKCTVYESFKRCAKAAGLPETRFHDLRHTYATLALEQGTDIKTVSSNLGHATVAFTLDTYGHVTEKMQQDSADRMQRYLQSI